MQQLIYMAYLNADMAVCTCAFRNFDVRESLVAAGLQRLDGKSAPLLRGYLGFSGDLA